MFEWPNTIFACFNNNCEQQLQDYSEQSIRKYSKFYFEITQCSWLDFSLQSFLILKNKTASVQCVGKPCIIW